MGKVLSLGWVRNSGDPLKDPVGDALFMLMSLSDTTGVGDLGGAGTS